MPVVKQSWSDKYLTIQTVIGMLTFVFGVGVLYAEFSSMKKDISNIELRQDRQFQLIQSLQTDVGKMREELNYSKGFIDGLNKSKQP